MARRDLSVLTYITTGYTCITRVANERAGVVDRDAVPGGTVVERCVE